jgi:hypothetical protein
VCCQVGVSATSWSLVQGSPTNCGASLCVITKPREQGGHSPRWAAEPNNNNNNILLSVIYQLNLPYLYMLYEYHVIYSARFHLTGVGFETYYPSVRGHYCT